MPNPVTIMGRSSSITNSFVNGIIPVIVPSEMEIKKALEILEQNEDDVRCVYCGDKKTEWDHLHPLIKNKEHTGYITEIANLVPACSKCNQSKGNSDWKEWMLSNAEKSPRTRRIPDLDKRIQLIEKYDNYFHKKIIDLEEIAGKDLWEKYKRAKDSIIFNMESAQKIMDEIKEKVSKQTNSQISRVSDRPRKVFVVRPPKKNIETLISQNQNDPKMEQIKYSSTLLDNFQVYLIRRGYKEFTPAGLPSTAPQYKNAVSEIKSYEGIPLELFCRNIDSIIKEYDVGGRKQNLGEQGHRTWINALKRFKEYLVSIK